MPLKKATRVYAVALSLVAVLATVANAQTAPTLTATANGVQVTINWNNIPGALGYQLEVGTTAGGSQVGVIQLPASIQRPIVVNAPPATYFLRVKGLAVGIVGPASNEVSVTSGAAACTTIAPPSLASSVNGPNATFTWNAVGGAGGYQLQFGTAPGRTDLAHQLGANVTSYTQNVPFTGTFYARVVAGNACGLTAVSNERAFTIGNACATLNPALSASVQGGMVTFAWSGVTGATGAAIELSRFNGQSEASEPINAAAASYQRYIPLEGTFYARIVAQTPCGVTASSYIPFTVTNPNVGGPRTADPAPGTRLPLPGYGREVVQNMANAYRGDLYASCGGSTWMFRVLQELRRRDSRWGLNWKRGHVGDMSHDIISYNYTARPDNLNPEIYLVDVIGGHCGPSPDWNWQDVTAFTPRFSSECAAAGCSSWTIDPYRRQGLVP